MKKILHLLIVCLSTGVLFLTQGCDDYFQDINTDKNNPVTVDPGIVLRNALFKTARDLQFQFWDFDGFTMQYYEFITSASASQYNWSPATGERIWYNTYETLADVEDVLRKSTASGDDTYRAAALILKAYLFSLLVDHFGDVPYSEALQARYNQQFFPAYDDQTAIYRDLIAKLDTANTLLSEDAYFLYGGDEGFFEGDPVLWKKFANSLRLRLLMRVSEVASFNASAEIAEMVADPATYPMFESNDESATYHYSGTIPNVNPVYTYRDWEYESNVPTLEFINRLKALDDPRIGAYFWPTPATRGTDSLSYEGIPTAITGDSLSYYSASNLSVSNQDILRQATTPTWLMTYAEVQFILAEAALKGYISGSAEAYYQAGITAACEQWEVTDITEYLASADVTYAGTLEQIITQKYLALYQIPGQAWAEYRRTGYPVLIAGPNASNDGKVPQRLMYPSLEQTLNGASLQAAIDRMGGTDDLNRTLFWVP
ncbi:MAG: SusD/RagB family nutrient-binding outer membrane lipoprotein [Bacteroidia bacterium]|nr:SusD/RagB family nutrient-binding outer membrane lipoprotein [Bacteroidia bacterium]